MPSRRLLPDRGAEPADPYQPVASHGRGHAFSFIRFLDRQT
jgi:hypothetical protein